MFRIVCDCMRSGSIELYLTEIIRSGLQMFVVCLVGVRQRNFEPVVCVCVRSDGRTNYPNLFCYKTLHVSGIFSAHHQEFSTVYSALVSFMQVR